MMESLTPYVLVGVGGFLGARFPIVRWIWLV